mmetsp:Transcript_22033/g.33684  ORF Transcript_22033/g.33684 Transcript_22033/m.33684 type:complete len:100 (+) Transcript_22033:89-388(+)
MFKLRYSRKACIIEWDSASFTDCRPCEANAIEEEIIELVQALEFGPEWCEGVDSLTLAKANEEARLVCERVVLEALDGFDNLPHASTMWMNTKNPTLLI